MSDEHELERLTQQAPVVVFHSPVTDLAGIDDALIEAGVDWTRVELGMGSASNRALFHGLQAMTGRQSLPQLFVDGRFVGGIEALPVCLGGSAAPPPSAAWMGYLGLLPFLIGMTGLWVDAPGSGTWLAAYGAVILSFVGAMHWGSAARAGSYAAKPYVLSVLPALIGWVALLLPQALGLGLMGGAFLLWRWVEYRLLDRGQPGWLARMRGRLTLGAALSLLVGAAAIPYW